MKNVIVIFEDRGETAFDVDFDGPMTDTGFWDALSIAITEKGYDPRLVEDVWPA